MNSQHPLTQASRDAWLYLLPLVEVAAARQRACAAGAPLNHLVHLRALASAKDRFVTTPNNDTLYSNAHLDLGAGPATLRLPQTTSRYQSVALMDAYSNNFAVLGTRTLGPAGGCFLLIGPNDAAPTDQLFVRSPTPHVWLLARTAVYGPDDLDAARAAQRGLELEARPAVAMPTTPVTRSATWSEFFAGAARLMAFNPPPLTDLALLRSVAVLNLSHFDAARFDADERGAIEAGVTEAQRLVLQGGGSGYSLVNGWAYPGADLGAFGQNYPFRARIAVSALAALPPVEAMYLRAIGEGNAGCFDGQRRYRLRFAAGALPPAQSFWSLTLYDATADGQFFFADNPLDRYSIGDRTPGLVYDPDGSLELLIGADPGPARRTNWLPSSGAPFALFLRAYLPSADLLDGHYRLPAITPARGRPFHTRAGSGKFGEVMVRVAQPSSAARSLARLPSSHRTSFTQPGIVYALINKCFGA